MSRINTPAAVRGKCEEEAFGTDPDYGFVKNCYTGPTTAGPSGTTYCAAENGDCAFSGTRTVEYGAGTSFTQRSLSGGTPCDNAVFGDPDVGVVKACFLVS